MFKDYYTVEQISDMLNIHPKTVQRYIREGRLRATKIGKSWRVAGHDLSVFMPSMMVPKDSVRKTGRSATSSPRRLSISAPVEKRTPSAS